MSKMRRILVPTDGSEHARHALQFVLDLVAETDSPIPEIHELLVKALDYLAAKDPIPALITRFEQRLAEILGIIPEGETGMAAAAIEDSFHRKLPVQRRQLLEWISQHGRRMAD